jgi:hypothetical protein
MMFLKLFRTYQTGKTLYKRVIKPIYQELRKDAYASEAVEIPKKKKRKTIKSNAVNQKSKRSNRRKANS